MIIIGHFNSTKYLLPFCQQLFTTLFSPSLTFTIELNPPTCHIFICSHNDTEVSIRYPKAFILFISGEPQQIIQQPIHFLIDCKESLNVITTSKLTNSKLTNSKIIHSLTFVKTSSLPPFTNIFIPFFAFSFFERTQNQTLDILIKSSDLNSSNIAITKSNFCAYMYRYDVPHRVKLFQALNKYKPVDALGKSQNPTYQFKSRDGDPFDEAVEKYQTYKFVICCENTSLPGYVTEKIVNAMIAKAIPIYFGTPDVVRFFNPASFINVHDFKTLEDMVQYVIYVDQNDELYHKMLLQPWFIDNKIPETLTLKSQIELISKHLKLNLLKFYPFLFNINTVTQPPSKTNVTQPPPNIIIKPPSKPTVTQPPPNIITKPPPNIITQPTSKPTVTQPFQKNETLQKKINLRSNQSQKTFGYIK